MATNDRPDGERTMRAAVVVRPGVVEIVRAALPAVGARQVRVRVEGCGVCASNVPPWEGREWFQYPLAPGQLGHEAWGRVEALGAGVGGVRVGQRVAMLSYHGLAEFDVADEAAIVPLPESMDRLPFPGEPLGCAMNIFGRADVRAGQTAAIVGVGFLGALLTRMARDEGARVIALTRRADSMRLAREMGADDVVAMDDPRAAVDRVAELTGGRGGYDVRGFCDRVIECTGKAGPLDLAGEICAVRGKLIVAGYHQDGPRNVNMQLWNWRGLDVINAHERDPARYVEGMRKAAEWVASGRLDPTPLYTHVLPLERIGEALDMARDRPGGFVKALIRVA